MFVARIRKSAKIISAEGLPIKFVGSLLLRQVPQFKLHDVFKGLNSHPVDHFKFPLLFVENVVDRRRVATLVRGSPRCMPGWQRLELVAPSTRWLQDSHVVLGLAHWEGRVNAAGSPGRQVLRLGERI